MTPEETDRAVDAAYEALRAAQDALTIARLNQWRAHSEAWLTDLRTRFPALPGSVEVIETRVVDKIGPVPHTRWVETIEGWEGIPWRSRPQIVRKGRRARWDSEPAESYAIARDVWSSEPQITPAAHYRGGWADWCAFCARHGHAPE